MLFATAINSYWQPIQTWTIVALIISQNGNVFSAMAGTALAAIIVYGVFLNRRAKLSVLRLYGKLSQQDHLLIKAVSNAQELGNSSTQNIAVEFQKLTGIQNSESWFTQKLQDAENSGLIKKKLSSVEDNPTFSWKCQMPSKKAFFNWIPIKFT